jgi:hypothetical protein
MILPRLDCRNDLRPLLNVRTSNTTAADGEVRRYPPSTLDSSLYLESTAAQPAVSRPTESNILAQNEAAEAKWNDQLISAVSFAVPRHGSFR